VRGAARKGGPYRDQYEDFEYHVLGHQYRKHGGGVEQALNNLMRNAGNDPR